MFAIPMKVSATHYDLFLCLEDENIERIKAYDPAEVLTSLMGEPWNGMLVRGFIVTYAAPGELAEVTRLCNEGRAEAALRLLSRGWKYRPDQGDSDDTYSRM
jgi:hypothetical protein